MYWRMCYNVKGAKCRKDRKIMAVIYENKVKELGKDIMKKSMPMYTEEFTLCLNWQQKKWKIPEKKYNISSMQSMIMR